jgi:hypothetical protein
MIRTRTQAKVDLNVYTQEERQISLVFGMREATPQSDHGISLAMVVLTTPSFKRMTAAKQ